MKDRYSELEDCLEDSEKRSVRQAQELAELKRLRQWQPPHIAASATPREPAPRLVDAAIGADKELSRLAHIVISKTVMECAKLTGHGSVLDSGWQIPASKIVDASLREYFGILLSESRQRVKPLVDAMLEAEKPVPNPFPAAAPSSPPLDLDAARKLVTPRWFVCTKCGYTGTLPDHDGCNYTALESPTAVALRAACTEIESLRARLDEAVDAVLTRASADLTRYAVAEGVEKNLSFASFRRVNLERAKYFPSACQEWILAQWSNACLGELGEAANIIKKLDRGDFTLEEARQDLADELSDAFTYLDHLAFHAGIDLGEAVAHKFNVVSERRGLPHRLPVTPRTPESQP